jgi:lysophospholipase L1-like esterase
MLRLCALATALACAACSGSAGAVSTTGGTSQQDSAGAGPATVTTTTGSPTTFTPTRTSAPFQVVGLGDSVTAGTNCNCEDFIHLYAAALSRLWGRPDRAINLGRGGLTSPGLQSQLQADPTTRVAVAGADVVVITIGANDLLPALQAWDDAPGVDEEDCGGACDSATIDRTARHNESILDSVRELRGGQPTDVFVTTYWNVFADGAVGERDRGSEDLQWSDQLTRRLNAQIEGAALMEGAVTVDLYQPFKADGTADPTPLLADDGDHPNAAGHRAIELALLAASPKSAP